MSNEKCECSIQIQGSDPFVIRFTSRSSKNSRKPQMVNWKFRNDKLKFCIKGDADIDGATYLVDPKKKRVLFCKVTENYNTQDAIDLRQGTPVFVKPDNELWVCKKKKGEYDEVYSQKLESVSKSRLTVKWVDVEIFRKISKKEKDD